jgi:Glycosyl transferase family 2
MVPHEGARAIQTDDREHAPSIHANPVAPKGGEEPLVTVVMSVYRSDEFLLAAVQSVLDQTYANLEFLVVDDGNPPGSLDAIVQLGDDRIRILRQEHAGKAAGMNLALSTARGEFYVIQDADDISAPRRVEVQLQMMVENPDVACVFCGFDLIMNGTRLAPLFPAKSRQECRDTIDAFRMPGHDPTTMFRMSLVADLRYEETLAIGQGFDYVLRVGERHPMLTVGECLYSYRVESTSHSRRDPIRREELVRAILTRACDRRGLAEEDRPEALRRPPPTPDSDRNPDNNLPAHFIESTLHLRRQGQYGEALRTALACARLRPLDPHYLKALVLVLTPGPLLWLLRRRAVSR